MVNLTHPGLLDMVIRHLPKNVQRECWGIKGEGDVGKGHSCLVCLVPLMPRRSAQDSEVSMQTLPRPWRWRGRQWAAFIRNRSQILSESVFSPNLAPDFQGFAYNSDYRLLGSSAVEDLPVMQETLV